MLPSFRNTWMNDEADEALVEDVSAAQSTGALERSLATCCAENMTNTSCHNIAVAERVEGKVR